MTLAHTLSYIENNIFYVYLGDENELGKITGGYLFDKYNWTLITIFSLLISIPILAFFPFIPTLALLGVFLFSFVYALPVRLLSNLFKGRSALVFGIAELLILFQTFGEDKTLNSGWVSFFIMSLSGVSLVSVIFLIKLQKEPINV